MLHDAEQFSRRVVKLHENSLHLALGCLHVRKTWPELQPERWVSRLPFTQLL